MNEQQCADCSQPIPAERLEAVPDAERCAACQRQLEQLLPKPLVDDPRRAKRGLPDWWWSHR